MDTTLHTHTQQGEVKLGLGLEGAQLGLEGAEAGWGRVRAQQGA